MKTIDYGYSGAVTYWRPGPCSRSVLEASLQHLGLFDRLPAPAGDAAILRAALAKAVPAGCMVRPTATEGRFVVIDESRGHDFNSYEHAGAAATDGTREGLALDFADTIEYIQRDILSVVSTAAVTRLLVGTLADLGATSQRDSGGVYFLPRGAPLARWELIAAAVEGAAVGGANVLRLAVYVLRTGTDAGSLRAIHDGILDDTNEALAVIERSMNDPDLGPRALETRADRCRGLADRLRLYEDVIGQSLTTAREACERIESAAVSAAMMARAQQIDSLCAAV